jgi:hypothetical protein
MKKHTAAINCLTVMSGTYLQDTPTMEILP